MDNESKVFGSAEIMAEAYEVFGVEIQKMLNLAVDDDVVAAIDE